MRIQIVVALAVSISTCGPELAPPPAASGEDTSKGRDLANRRSLAANENEPERLRIVFTGVAEPAFCCQGTVAVMSVSAGVVKEWELREYKDQPLELTVENGQCVSSITPVVQDRDLLLINEVSVGVHRRVFEKPPRVLGDPALQIKLDPIPVAVMVRDDLNRPAQGIPITIDVRESDGKETTLVRDRANNRGQVDLLLPACGMRPNQKLIIRARADEAQRFTEHRDRSVHTLNLTRGVTKGSPITLGVMRSEVSRTVFVREKQRGDGFRPQPEWRLQVEIVDGGNPPSSRPLTAQHQKTLALQWGNHVVLRPPENHPGLKIFRVVLDGQPVLKKASWSLEWTHPPDVLEQAFLDVVLGLDPDWMAVPVIVARACDKTLLWPKTLRATGKRQNGNLAINKAGEVFLRKPSGRSGQSVRVETTGDDPVYARGEVKFENGKLDLLPLAHGPRVRLLLDLSQPMYDVFFRVRDNISQALENWTKTDHAFVRAEFMWGTGHEIKDRTEADKISDAAGEMARKLAHHVVPNVRPSPVFLISEAVRSFPSQRPGVRTPGLPPDRLVVVVADSLHYKRVNLFPKTNPIESRSGLNVTMLVVGTKASTCPQSQLITATRAGQDGSWIIRCVSPDAIGYAVKHAIEHACAGVRR